MADESLLPNITYNPYDPWRTLPNPLPTPRALTIDEMNERIRWIPEISGYDPRVFHLTGLQKGPDRPLGLMPGDARPAAPKPAPPPPTGPQTPEIQAAAPGAADSYYRWDWRCVAYRVPQLGVYHPGVIQPDPYDYRRGPILPGVYHETATQAAGGIELGYIPKTSPEVHAVHVHCLSRGMTEHTVRALFELNGMLQVFGVSMHEEPSPNAAPPLMAAMSSRGGTATRGGMGSGGGGRSVGKRPTHTTDYQPTQSATVMYYQGEDAELAILHLNDFEWQGCRLQVRRNLLPILEIPVPVVQPRPSPTPSSTMIEIRFLPFAMLNEESIASEFGHCGKIWRVSTCPEYLKEQDGTIHSYFTKAKILFNLSDDADKVFRDYNEKLFRDKWRLEVKSIPNPGELNRATEVELPARARLPDMGRGRGRGRGNPMNWQSQRPPVAG